MLYFSLPQLAVARRVARDLDGGDGLYYLHGDHLGSLSLMTDSDGALVADSMARFLPFGAYRSDGSQPVDGNDLSDRGFTGHYEDREIGLTYMQARYYAPDLRRFVSADTLVHDPGASIGYNRFAYAIQNPVIHVDRMGHCPGTFEGGNGEHDGCWAFLMNEFCSGGSQDICPTGDWKQWFAGLGQDMLGRWWFGDGGWAPNELLVLRDALTAVIEALGKAGINWEDSGLADVRYRKWNQAASLTFPSKVVSLGNVSQRTIWHETGHAISFMSYNRPQAEMRWFAEQSAAGRCIPPGAPDCVTGVPYEQYCFQSYCDRRYGILQLYTGRRPELWADAFAAWVHVETHGHVPSWIAYTGYKTYDSPENPTNWSMMFLAVEHALSVTYP